MTAKSNKSTTRKKDTDNISYEQRQKKKHPQQNTSKPNPAI
jgi:hypothetical protein